MADTFVNNEAESRYELQLEGGTAIAAYQRSGDVVAFTHTEVPHSLRGKGFAGKLIERALADVRRQGLKVRPQCPYVVDYVARHPEVQDLVAGSSA